MEQTIVKIEAQVREADKNPRQLRAAGVDRRAHV